MNGYGIVKFHNDWILRRRRQTLLEGLNNPYLIRAAGTAVIQLVYAIPLPNRSETELQ